MALNIYGKDAWATKITSMLEEDYKQYDESDYDQAPSSNQWIIAKKDGQKRKEISDSFLQHEKFATSFHGLDDLDGVTHGEGLIVGEGTLIRASANIGKQVYIGAGTVIDIEVKIGDFVTIGDNVTIGENVTIEDYTNIESGTVILK